MPREGPTDDDAAASFVDRTVAFTSDMEEEEEEDCLLSALRHLRLLRRSTLRTLRTLPQLLTGEEEEDTCCREGISTTESRADKELLHFMTGGA